jgi:hypothetical protein
MTVLDEPSVDHDQSAARLLGAIAGDAGRLAGQQVELFRAEVRDAAGKLTASAKLVAAGAVLAAVGTLCLAVSLALLLNYLVPSLPAWACWLILAAVCFAAGAALLLVGRSGLSRLTPPRKSLAALRENVSWIANRRT